MLDRMRQRSADEGGVALIELLMVILIIGIQLDNTTVGTGPPAWAGNGAPSMN